MGTPGAEGRTVTSLPSVTLDFSETLCSRVPRTHLGGKQGGNDSPHRMGEKSETLSPDRWAVFSDILRVTRGQIVESGASSPVHCHLWGLPKLLVPGTPPRCPTQASPPLGRSRLELSGLSLFSLVLWRSRVRLFATAWTVSRQASLSITNSWSLLKLVSIRSAMPSNHLIFCHPLLLLLGSIPANPGCQEASSPTLCSWIRPPPV